MNAFRFCTDLVFQIVEQKFKAHFIVYDYLKVMVLVLNFIFLLSCLKNVMKIIYMILKLHKYSIQMVFWKKIIVSKFSFTFYE